MFQKFFSCFNDSTLKQQVDLSRKDQPAQFMPLIPPESNIEGKNINFDIDDSQSNALYVQFLAQSNKVLEEETKQKQEYYYQNEYGEMETKITTAPPSKTNNYEQNQQLDYNSKGIPAQPKKSKNTTPTKNQSIKNIEQQRALMHSPSSVSVSMTEKKLNNYLQQAKFLITNIHDRSGYESKGKGMRLKNFSIDQEANKPDYINNDDSSNILFNAASISNNEPDSPGRSKVTKAFKQGFGDRKEEEDKSKGKGGQTKKKIQDKKLQNKKNENIMMARKSELINFRPQQSFDREIDETKKQTFEEEALDFSDQFNNISIPDLKNQFSGGQIDLGAYKSLHKRQSSKTESGADLQFMNKLKKDKIQAQDSIVTKGTLKGHKKTNSTITGVTPQMKKGTRNTVFSNNRKTITSTTSPTNENLSKSKNQKGSFSRNNVPQNSFHKKSSQSISFPKTNVTLVPPMSEISKTTSIKEAQNENEEEEAERQFERHRSQQRAISPSEQSSFQFQPKFYKPSSLFE